MCVYAGVLPVRACEGVRIITAPLLYSFGVIEGLIS